MSNQELNVVTGAFSYTGKYITRRLLAMGKSVTTLTGHPGRTDEFGEQVRSAPYNFDRPELLVHSLAGATTLYNTYWVRFDHGTTTFEGAVRNTQTLVQAAKKAGVQRIVHISVTNPSLASPLPYFRGKARLEEIIQGSGLSYAIIRPTVIYGLEDILINNIAYLLRKFPLFAIPGSGKYRLQPVFVEDTAEISVQAGEAGENMILDAAGPEVFTFDEMVRLIARTTGSRSLALHLPPSIPLLMSGLIGRLVGDVVLTRDEYQGLAADLLISSQPPTGHTRMQDWLKANIQSLGRRYASELERHFK